MNDRVRVCVSIRESLPSPAGAYQTAGGSQARNRSIDAWILSREVILSSQGVRLAWLMYSFPMLGATRHESRHS
jgi:hypothetical protein